MVDLTKPQKNAKDSVDSKGTWTPVVKVLALGGQAGIWLEIANGNWVYYDPRSEFIKSLAFQANVSCEVSIPSNGPADGLSVTKH
jgi:hypothetical protein